MQQIIFWIGVFAAAAVLFCVPVSYTVAQQAPMNMNPPGNEGKPNSVGLLSLKAVQEELRLSPEEIKELETFYSQLKPTVPHSEVVAKLTDILGMARLTRLKELSRQGAGAEIFLNDEEAASAIQLTAAQRKAIVAIVERSYQSRHELLRKRLESASPEDRAKTLSSPEFYTEYRKIQVASKEEALSTLTESQRDTYRKLEGIEFNFSGNW